MRSSYLLLIFAIQTSALCAQGERKFNDSVVRSIRHDLREGDVVFRNGAGKESALIRTFAVGIAVFSHCGIVVKNASGTLHVIHVMGGGPSTESDLYADSFEDFVTDSTNTSFGFARYELSQTELIRLRSFTDSLRTKKIRFDYDFAVDSSDRLYCTELVARCLAYSTREKIIIPEYRRDLSGHPARLLFNRSLLVYYPLEYLQYNKHVSTFQLFNFQSAAIKNGSH